MVEPDVRVRRVRVVGVYIEADSKAEASHHYVATMWRLCGNCVIIDLIDIAPICHQSLVRHQTVPCCRCKITAIATFVATFLAT